MHVIDCVYIGIISGDIAPIISIDNSLTVPLSPLQSTGKLYLIFIISALGKCLDMKKRLHVLAKTAKSQRNTKQAFCFEVLRGSLAGLRSAFLVNQACTECTAQSIHMLKLYPGLREK